MQVRTVRSDLTEIVDEVDAVVVAPDGSESFVSGDADRPLFYRSAIKPLQATVALEAGADLPPEHLALACASHGGFPAHLAIVERILADGGLTEDDLRCPPAWPLATSARDLVVANGTRRPRRLFHNCSGKHAAWLRACRAAGWPIDGYLEPDHPLQRRIVQVVRDATGVEPEPVGVDGCGAPTLRGTVRGLARAFSRLTTDDRFTAAARAIDRFPALVADDLRPDGRFAMWWGGPVKVGAAGLVGAARNGVGLAARSRSGDSGAAVMGLIEAARRVGLLVPAMDRALADVSAPPVMGGGRIVGRTSVDERP